MLLLQGATVTVFNQRPLFLSYHDHTNHVTDIGHTENIHVWDETKVLLSILSVFFLVKIEELVSHLLV